jgi:hypothetical protein
LLFKYNNPSYLNIFYPNICEDTNHSWQYLLNLKTLANDFKLSNSWLDIKDWFKGIVLDNYQTDDYLKYTFEPSVLTWSFAVEMQVRAEALKRTSGQYYLLDWWNWNRLFNEYGNLKLYYNGSFASYSLNSFTKTWSIKIQLVQEPGSLKIKLNNDVIIDRSNNLQNNWYYYIWNLTWNQKQWNDVIDYVKVSLLN